MLDSVTWRQQFRWSIAAVMLAMLASASALAFFDEVVALKAELAAWEAVHADADFSDVLEQLDDLAGTVFVDVADDAWYAPYVSSLAEWGIVSGYRDALGKATGDFGPGNPVTVAEILKMAAEAAQIDETACAPPTRHTEATRHWAAAYVGCAEARNVRIFATGEVVSLDRPATRAEVLSIVHDFFGDVVPPIEPKFADTAGHRFGADIAFATLRGIVSGDVGATGNPTGVFRPDAPVKRAEAAKILVLRIKERARQDTL